LNERADKLLVNPRTVVPQPVCGVFRCRETFAFSDDRHEPSPGRFVLVDPDGYRTEAALAKWVKRGVDSVSTVPAKSNGRPMGRRRSRDAVPAEQRNSVRSRHLDAAVAAVKKRGIAVLMVNETPACRMAMINDTEGNIVTLHKRKVA